LYASKSHDQFNTTLEPLPEKKTLQSLITANGGQGLTGLALSPLRISLTRRINASNSYHSSAKWREFKKGDVKMLALMEFELQSGEVVLINLGNMKAFKASTLSEGTELVMIDGTIYLLKASMNEIKYMMTPRQNQAPNLRGL
jgi:hypothetical protein